MMKDLLKKLQKKSNKKGFTLVEIIVVLVILAILAAIAVPSVIGYVDEAKESRYIQEARSIYVVIQTEEAKALALEDTDLTAIYGPTAKRAVTDTFKKQVESTTTLQLKSLTRTVDASDNKKVTWEVVWKSDDGKGIKATINKNKDITIDSKKEDVSKVSSNLN